MTYTFKLAKRLAVARLAEGLALVLLVASCSDTDLTDTSDPETAAPATAVSLGSDLDAPPAVLLASANGDTLALTASAITVPVGQTAALAVRFRPARAGTTIMVISAGGLRDTVVVTATDTSPTAPPPPPPPPPPPLPSGTACPSGALAINPGDSWPAKVSAAPAGAVFCVRAGTYTRQSVVPKSGQTFVGERGAVMDGQRATTYAFSGSASNVTIKGLKVMNYVPPDGSKAMIQGESGRGWVVDSNEITGSAQQGVRVGKQGRIRGNFIHHNGVLGIGLYRADSAVIEGNHLSSNPASAVSESGATARAGQMKIFKTVGVVVRNNVVEDGPEKGIWFDTDNYQAVIEGNTVRRQGGPGVWYEASYAATIRHNSVSGCGLAGTSGWVGNAGIQVTNSYPVEIYGNTVVGCEHGITGMAVGGASNPDYSTGNRGPKALGIHVHDNTITQPSGKAAGVRTTGTGADSAFTWAGRSTWKNNRYFLSGNASPFTWVNTNKTAVQWTALGFDASGSFAP